MIRCPCSSARILRTDASAPGCSPRIARRHRAQADQPQDLHLDVERHQALPQGGVGDAPPLAHQVDELVGGRAVAPQGAARRQRDPLVAERDLRQRPAVVLVADEVLGRQAHVGEEHLVEGVGAGHLHDRADLDAGRVHRADEVGDALVLRHIGVGAGDEDAELGEVGQRGPDLLAVDHVLVAVADRPGAEVGEVGAGAGLAEQLAPDLLAGEQRQQVAVAAAPGYRHAAAWGRPSRCRSCCSAGAHRPTAARRR